MQKGERKNPPVQLEGGRRPLSLGGKWAWLGAWALPVVPELVGMGYSMPRGCGRKLSTCSPNKCCSNLPVLPLQSLRAQAQRGGALLAGSPQKLQEENALEL